MNAAGLAIRARPPRAAALALAALLAAPAVLALLALLAAWIEPPPAVWGHLLRWVLPEALANTVLLGLGVALVAAVFGGALAALVTLYEFPGRRMLAPLLVLPLALPSYVYAFCYVGLFDVGGTLRAPLLHAFGSGAVPELRNLPGAVLLLGLALFPYVYLPVRAALAAQGPRLLEAARTLGLSRGAALRRAVLPAVRPALVAGASLALMEAIADFGAVATLGVETLATAIYRTWFGLGSLTAATQLAGGLLLLAGLALAVERAGRGAARFDARGGAVDAARVTLRGAHALAAVATLVLVLTLGFGLPVFQLLRWASQTPAAFATLAEPARATLAVAGGATVAIVVTGLGVALLLRTVTAPALAAVARETAGLGYAVPGTVLAVGLMSALIGLERALAGDTGTTWLTGGVLAVWLGLQARFLRIGIGAADAALAAVPPSLPEAAALLGVGRRRRVRTLWLPLLRPHLVAGALLAFVECAKELPATLMLRPLGADTLAIKIYNATSEGLWAQAAWPALALVGVGLLPVLLLWRGSRT